MKKVLSISIILISITFFIGGLTLAYIAVNNPGFFNKEAIKREVAPIVNKAEEVAPGVVSTLSEVAETAVTQLSSANDTARGISTPLTIYKNDLSNGWENRSQNANVNFSGFPAYDGQTAMIMDFAAGGGTVYLHALQPIELSGHNILRFWIHGGVTGGQQIAVGLVGENDQILKTIAIAPPYPNDWRQVDLLLTDLEAPTQIHGVVWQDTSGGPQPVFYVDEVALVDEPLGGMYAESPASLALTIEADQPLYPISPLIYGMNFADEATAEELDLPLNRWGGNATSRYNYAADTTNAGSNWYFENTTGPQNNITPAEGSSTADAFVQQNNRTETESLLTLPLIGWVAKDSESCGFSISKYGAQMSSDGWRPDCGNGLLVNGQPVTGVNPEDTSIAIEPAFIQEWMAHLTQKFGAADDGGVRFYGLDNEPMLWSHTHRDVRPTELGLDEFWAITEAYAVAAKEADPTGQVLGPVEWGWTNYFWSDLDVKEGTPFWENARDRLAHDNMELVAWYLRQMARYEERTGQRLLDYLDLHYYPQAVGIAFSEAGDESQQALRLRTTRSLWDRAYVDESWIAEPVFLIPRMHDWVNEFYPGTKLAITEYNWGGLEHINGAVTQAEVLGIFAREQLDLAAIWAPPKSDEPGMYAFRMYRNYDGQKSKFGDTYVAAESSQDDVLSVFAARREADGALTVMVMNKSHIPMTAPVTLNGYAGGNQAEVYRYSEVDLHQIVQLPAQVVENGAFETTFPAMSITLFVFPAE